VENVYVDVHVDGRVEDNGVKYVVSDRAADGGTPREWNEVPQQPTLAYPRAVSRRVKRSYITKPRKVKNVGILGNKCLKLLSIGRSFLHVKGLDFLGQQ
jgi:hypothetical protein